MKNQFLVLTLIFCSGIFFASLVVFSLYLAYILAVIFLILSLVFYKKDKPFNFLLVSLMFFLGAISLYNSRIFPSGHISNVIRYPARQPYVFKGVINTQPQFKINQSYFIFRIDTLQKNGKSYACRGDILVYLKSREPFYYGEELILRGDLKKPFINTSQGFQNYLYNRGIFFILRVKNDLDVLRLNKFRGSLLRKSAFYLKERIERIILKYTSNLTAGILRAMILGEKSGIPWFVNDAMMKSGTVHILVVSGFNVGIVVLVIELFLKLIRIPRNIRFILAVPILIFYCLITGISTPVLRATIMAITFILASLIKRENDSYNSLSLAALLILGFNPNQLFDIGFQLSFVSVLAIVAVYPRVKALVFKKEVKIRCLRWLMEGALVSFAAWIGTMGLIAKYFRIFSPITVLANIIIVPLSCLITLGGFSLIIMELIAPFFVRPFAHSLEFIVSALVYINLLLVKIPGASLSF